MAVHGAVFDDLRETGSRDQFTRQGPRMLRIRMGHGPVNARLGSMVAHQGDVRLHPGPGGVDRLVRAALTGEGVPIVQATGEGELFLADDAAEVHVLYLDDDLVFVNGANVLAFSASVDWDVHRVPARGGMPSGGLSHLALRGSGYVAVTSRGEPVALDVGRAPTFAHAPAVVLWTAGVRPDLRVDTDAPGSLLLGSTGETVQLAFRGNGHVLVQPARDGVTGAGEQPGRGGPGVLLE